MLFRWLNPALFFGAAVVIYEYNGHHTGRQYVLPGMQALVGRDLHAQGRITWQIVVAVGVVLLVWAIVDQVRAGRRKRAAEDDAPGD